MSSQIHEPGYGRQNVNLEGSSKAGGSGRARPGSKAGMTLVEVMVAFGVFAIGMLGVFALGAQLRRTNALADDWGRATAIAESRIESLLAADYTTVSNGSQTAGPYLCTWRVLTNAVPGASRLQVTVSWPDIDGQSHETTLNSCLIAP
jgi:Tfp pilus assembly protein PilV